MTSPGEPLRLEAHSPTPPDLFEDIARQVMALFIAPQEVGAALREKVAVEGESLEQLLREWVTVLLDLVRIQHMVFGQIRVTRLETPQKGPYLLQAEAVGELIDPHRHPLALDPAWLKCREAFVRKDGEQYRAEILLNQ